MSLGENVKLIQELFATALQRLIFNRVNCENNYVNRESIIAVLKCI